MKAESEILALQARVTDLGRRLDFLYNHLGIPHVRDTGMAEARVVDMLKRGNKIEAIKFYREIHNCGLAEAKQAVEGIEVRLGL
jgi:large subunit ribosomal protein L7/L12